MGDASFSAAVFHTDFKNRQDFIFLAGAHTILTTPQAKIDGFEASLRLPKFGDFIVEASAGYQNGRVLGNPLGFTSAVFAIIASSPTTNYHSNKFPLVYPYSGNVSIDWAHEYNGGVRAYARANLAVKGGMYWELSNQDTQNTLYLLSLRAGLRVGDVDVSVFAENALNQTYYNEFASAAFTGLPAAQLFPATPRTYGTRVAVRF